MEKFKKLVKALLANVKKEYVTSFMAVLIPALIGAGYLNPEMKDEFTMLATAIAMLTLGTAKDALR